MSRKLRQEPKPRGRQTERALARYRAALEAAYPAAKGNTRVVPWQEGGFLVCVPLPIRVRERMRLFDRMAEVGTDLLLETGEYFLLTSR